MCVLTSTPGDFNEHQSLHTADLSRGLSGLPSVPPSIENWKDIIEGAAVIKQVVSMLSIIRMHDFITEQVGTKDFEPHCCYCSQKGWMQD